MSQDQGPPREPDEAVALSQAPARLRAQEIRGGYGRADVVKGVDVRAREGTVTILVGPKGCGKSTLLKLLLWLLQPREGAVLLDGTPLRDIPTRRNAQRLPLQHVRDGGFFAFNPYGNIGKVLVDAGFQRSAAIEAIPEDERIDISAERIQDFDGDFILTTYRSTAGDTPVDLTTYAEAVLPSWCDALHACPTRQMFHLSRVGVSATSYTALGQTAYATLSILGGREFVPFEER